MLQPHAGNICAGSTPGNAHPAFAGTAFANRVDRSQTWSISLPKILVDMVSLADTASAEFSAILAGEGLHHQINAYRLLQSAVTSKDIRAAFQSSLANVTAVHCTLYTAPFAHPVETANGAGDHAEDELIAAYHQAFLKECNFLWSGRSYIVKKTTPTYRGPVQANGVTTWNAGLTAPIGTQAANTAGDNALVLNPTRFNILWGAKRFPNAPASDGELQHYAAESLGISSYREGAGQAESADTVRKVFSVSLESISGTGLDGMGRDLHRHLLPQLHLQFATARRSGYL